MTWPVPNPHRSNASLESRPECSVVVADEIFRSAVPRERFGNLARQPVCRGVLGHRKPQQLPPSMAKNKKCVELLKGNRRNHEQINRRNPIHLVAKKGLPRLQRPISPRHHIDRDRGLSDLDAELEQLAMELGGAPERVLKTHSPDQVAYLFADPRSATERTGLPSPVGGDAQSMPTDDRVGPDDGYGIKDARVATIEPDEYDPVGTTQTHSMWACAAAGR